MFSRALTRLLSPTTNQSTVSQLCLRHSHVKPLMRRAIRVYRADGQEVTAARDSTGRPRTTQHRRIDGNRGELDGGTSYKDWESKILGGMRYTKLADKDKKYRQLVNAAQKRKVREKNELVVLEGRRLVGDALHSGAKVKGLYFSKVENLEGLDLSSMDGLLYRVTNNQMEQVSDVTTPPGIIALCEMPSPAKLKINTTHLLPITLVCDNIRDPGNMGSLLRSAAAVGCHKILLAKGNVDIWDPKVLRAGAGCHFRTYIRHNLDWRMISGLLNENCRYYLALSEHTAEDKTEQMRSSESETDIDSDSDTEPTSTSSTLQKFTSSNDSSDFGLTVKNALATRLVGSSTQELVLVMGGETHGLSQEAFELGRRLGGQAIYLPMTPGIDSLNSAMAGTVLLYELRRQLGVSK